MRLPWSFARKGRSAGAEAAGSPAPAVQRAASGPAPARAWRELPPIQRTVEAMPLVAAPATFVDQLPGSQGLPPIVEPLGHEVSALATPGLVVAHARPVEAAPRSRLPAPVQRRARQSSEPPVGEALPAVEAHQDDVASTSAAAPASPPAAPAEAPPVRSVMVVAREAIRVPDRPLTSAAPALAAVQRSSARPSPGVPSPRAPGPPSQAAVSLPIGGMRRARPSSGTGAPLSVSRSAATPPSPSADRSNAAPPTPAPSTEDAHGSQGRRAGLGAPMAELPLGMSSASTSAGASPATRSVAGSPAVGPVVARRSVTRGAPAERGADATTRISPAASLAALPVLPLAGAVARPAAVQRSSPAVSREPQTIIRPTAGMDPLRPRPALQRAAAADDADRDDDGSEPGPPWWRSPGAGADGIPGIDPRVPVGGGLPTSSALVAGASWGPAVSRLASDASPAPSPGGARAMAMSGPLGGTRHGIQRLAVDRPGLPLARPAPAQAISTPAPAAIATTAAAPSDAPPAAATVQRAAPASASPGTGQSAALPAVSATPVVQRVEGSAPALPGERGSLGTPTERELDELAGALFGRIRMRLRSELIHDREARGLTFDRV